jgi:hypothetical protein
MSANLTITPVTDRKGLLQVVEFPFKLYRDDPNWVPPLIEERLDFFNTKKNPFYEHARYQLFLARREDEIVGTVGAVVDDNHNQFHNEKMGAFGFFETVNDPEVSAALLGQAEQWVRGQGMSIVRGPMNFSTNQEVACLIDGFETPPMVMMTHNPRYYPQLIENCGYVKAMDVYAYMSCLPEDFENAPAKLLHVAEKAAQKAQLRIRKVNMRHLEQEVPLLKQVYNQAWERNWGFVPMTEHELDHLVGGLKAIVDPNLVFVAETADGKPAGISITLPDIHQALRWSGGGHMFPFGLAKFMWQRRKISQCRLLIMGVIEEYRSMGIDAVFYAETAKAAMAHGYKQIESSWILESNTMMNRILQRLGGRRYKTYRIYEKALG